jgi:hypothetical protein
VGSRGAADLGARDVIAGFVWSTDEHQVRLVEAVTLA